MEAPPKQLASALEGLGRAIRLIADVRSGADALLEAFDSADSLRSHDPEQANHSICDAVEATKCAMDLLRATAKELELADVFVGAQQRYHDNQPWSLQVPVVCPDGALVPYSWKRQIAGQAAASAVDRTKLALRSFGEQKKRFLPHMTKAASSVGEATELSLPDVVKHCYVDVPAGISITAHLRFGKETCEMHKAAILQVAIPGVLRAIVSLRPAGTPSADAIAIYSADEAHVDDAWGTSAHQTFLQISECATNALHYFARVANASAALILLLKWLLSYRSLFAKPCKQCHRLLAIDRCSHVLLPPILREYDTHAAYHSGCLSM